VRKTLVLIFMLLLPLQTVWSALGSYCQHETGAAANHVGHHSHVHKPLTTSDLSSEAPGQSGDTHPDCDSCHSGSVPPVAWDAAAMPRLDNALRHTTWPPNYSAVPADRVERPQWRALA